MLGAFISSGISKISMYWADLQLARLWFKPNEMNTYLKLTLEKYGLDNDKKCHHQTYPKMVIIKHIQKHVYLEDIESDFPGKGSIIFGDFPISARASYRDRPIMTDTWAAPKMDWTWEIYIANPQPVAPKLLPNLSVSKGYPIYSVLQTTNQFGGFRLLKNPTSLSQHHHYTITWICLKVGYPKSTD